MSFSKDPNAVIPWVVRATETVLAAAAKFPAIKRVVLTSSSSAVIIPETNKAGVRVDESMLQDTPTFVRFPNML